MANWYKIPTSMRMTQREYRANIDGINIVFGAVLGFVLAGAVDLPSKEFIMLLLLSASVVIMVLYLGSSEYRLSYAATTALSIWVLPYLLERVFEISEVPNLQATLAAWALMVVVVELIPRHKAAKHSEDATDKTLKENSE